MHNRLLEILVKWESVGAKGTSPHNWLAIFSCSHFMPSFKKKFSNTFQSRGSSNRSCLVSLQITLMPLKDWGGTSEPSIHRAPCPGVQEGPKMKGPPAKVPVNVLVAGGLSGTPGPAGCPACSAHGLCSPPHRTGGSAAQQNALSNVRQPWQCLQSTSSSHLTDLS